MHLLLPYPRTDALSANMALPSQASVVATVTDRLNCHCAILDSWKENKKQNPFGEKPQTGPNPFSPLELSSSIIQEITSQRLSSWPM